VDGRVRKRIVLTGILQGIGCRPTVYRLAEGLGLGGWVINSTSGVRIEIEGPAERCSAFERELAGAIPPPGEIRTLAVEEVAAIGERSFRIEASLEDERTITPIPPDVAVCPECVSELFDPENHRRLYPFITCTLCGPRFTVVRSFPYDRERTSMADFTMCPRCRAEYEDPSDRRFHSQTNSCPECGPSLQLVDSAGDPIEGDPLIEAVGLLAQGKVLAVKGIGGFHLACNALDENAVRLLRDRKGRQDKPLAVMIPDPGTIRRYCRVGRAEEELLAAPAAPIVLLDTAGDHVAPNVAPLVGTLGVMLPYSPVHHLLFRHPAIPEADRLQVLVMTSGNRSEEPIARGNREALERLEDLADAFLLHDREIELRADDSIFRVMGGRRTVFRRSRGMVPGEFPLYGAAAEGPTVLAAGGDLKNALSIIKGAHAVPGPHVGDLASPVGQEYFKRSARVLIDYLEATPEIVAVDPHPEYFSNTLGREIDASVEEVFHHHAHAVSLLFEHGLTGPALFAVFDGTGYGTDGTIWGGEFLLADTRSFSREGHMGVFPLPGGEAAIREPVRILAALLAEEGRLAERFLPLTGEAAKFVPIWLEAVSKGINSPFTSSAGRLFDAAAAAVGFRGRVTFEGEAAMWLEARADPSERGEYEISFAGEDPVVVDVAALMKALAEDILSGLPKEAAAARFHNSVARTACNVLTVLAEKHGIGTVGLTGGCFQNRFLTERTCEMLEGTGLDVLLHESVPPNDGGIAPGQALCARSRRARPESVGGRDTGARSKPDYPRLRAGARSRGEMSFPLGITARRGAPPAPGPRHDHDRRSSCERY
jgi:hydrogenase maturation protein HypF